MLKVYPNYYKEFRCIADKCNHNCCIGWEIYIDDTTAEYYKNSKCSLSNKFITAIDFCENPHFVLTKNERCPFLNDKNLCEIIEVLGEDRLCSVCAEHPRFHNELPGRLESGLGMCCEEAARLIISQKEPVTLIKEGTEEVEDEIINLRDNIIGILQNRNLSVEERINKMLSLCKTSAPHTDKTLWADTFLSLERLDNTWTDVLLLLRNNHHTVNYEAFNTYMQTRETEYEQFCVYLIYRHLANAEDTFVANLVAKFTALSYFLLRNIGAVLYSKDNCLTFEKQTDLFRMYSAEIEYSDENLHILLEKLI